MNHTDLLNCLAIRHNLDNYLEIGVQWKNNNFNQIVCRNKFCVDTDPKFDASFTGTSDAFFARARMRFDLGFIDGFHTAAQVKRDFDNLLRLLLPYGFIVIHDCLPEEEKTTIVPRETKKWHGDVYKFVMTLPTYDGIDFATYPFDEGCCVVWQDETKKGIDLKITPSWKTYQSHRHLLRLQSLPDFPSSKCDAITSD